MADKVKRKDSSVRDIVRALVDGVITPRHAVSKLETHEMASYIRGFVAGQAAPPKINEESPFEDGILDMPDIQK